MRVAKVSTDGHRFTVIGSIAPVDLEQAFAVAHVVSACLALGAGAAVLLLRKGTHNHRVIGTFYVSALFLVDVAALSLHRESTFGVFPSITEGREPNA
jgi:uncharacterized membrane protein